MSAPRKSDEHLPLYEVKEFGEDVTVRVLDAHPEEIAGHLVPRRFLATVHTGNRHLGPFKVSSSGGKVRAEHPVIEDRFRRLVAVAACAVAEPGPATLRERESLIREIGRGAPSLQRVAEVCESARAAGYNEALEVGREFGYASTASYELIARAREAFPGRFPNEHDILRDVARLYREHPAAPRKAIVGHLPRRHGYLSPSSVDRLIRKAKTTQDPQTGRPFLET